MERMIILFPIFWLSKPNNGRISLIACESGAWVRLVEAKIPISPARAIPRMSKKPRDIWMPTASRYLRLLRGSRRAYDFFWISQRFTSQVYSERTPSLSMALISFNWARRSLKIDTHDRKWSWIYLNNWIIYSLSERISTWCWENWMKWKCAFVCLWLLFGA